mmetsp:Transcript_18738/g.19495  ORF Transcript_18738/g.19495 Transcript_18738/m.19495 type:complete len:546 (-) Transcript_18738:74-1711(-)
MFCSISGEVPSEPVISKKNGYLYEKRIILKYLEDEGKCPITGDILDKDDLINVQANKSIRPRPINSTSIPGLLTLFQNEWDDLMLETYTLKQHLDSTRQELSQALYQHDAACRVIARLMRERDEARAMLAALQAQGVQTISATNIERESSTRNGSNHENNNNSNNNNESTNSEMEVVNSSKNSNALQADVLTKIMDKCSELSKGRKGRKAPADLTSRDNITSFQETDIWTPHDSSKSGITSLTLTKSFEEHGHPFVSFTGGIDKTAILTDLSSGKVLSKLVGHSKKITSVSLTTPSSSSSSSFPIAITGSVDRQVKAWKVSNHSEGSDSFEYNEFVTFVKHENEVTGVTVHPTGDFVVSVSKDSSWCFNDLTRGICLSQWKNTENNDEFSTAQFHPDGLILATGTDKGAVRLWDIREQQNAANLTEHTSTILSLSFNENGYLLASGGNDGVAHIFDLRKLKSLFTITSNENSPVTAVSFDYSGTYLATGSENGAISVSVVKEWNPIVNFTTHNKAVTGLGWGNKASSLISSSLDRTIRVHKLGSS